MRAIRFPVRHLILCALAAVTLRAEEDPPAADVFETSEPVVKLGEVPAIKLPVIPPLTPERVAEIEGWIAALIEVDVLGYHSATDVGSLFNLWSERAPTISKNSRRVSQPIHRLVEAGPDAIPFLLAKLDDATPTKITIERKTEFASEMSVNPADRTERKPEKRKADEVRFRRKYIVKRGDICFTILGQITGRVYRAVRSQPTASVVINSPIESKELREAVRANWAAPDARSKYFQRLLLDYATKGVYNGESLDGWGRGSSLQIAASMRLAYYFPDETSDLLVKRIEALDVRKRADTGGLDAWMKREITNGVRTKEFLQALRRAKSPKVQRAVLEAARRTDDPELFLALLPTVLQSDVAFAARKLRGFIANLPPVEEGPYGAGFDLLSALVRTEGKGAKPDIEKYLQTKNSQRRHSICGVFEGGGPPWAVEILIPLLDDRRAGKWGKEYLICDAAAKALSTIRKDLVFDDRAPRKEWDKAIKAMKAKLAAAKP